jgi:hypothetical protein
VERTDSCRGSMTSAAKPRKRVRGEIEALPSGADAAAPVTRRACIIKAAPAAPLNEVRPASRRRDRTSAAPRRVRRSPRLTEPLHLVPHGGPDRRLVLGEPVRQRFQCEADSPASTNSSYQLHCSSLSGDPVTSPSSRRPRSTRSTAYIINIGTLALPEPRSRRPRKTRSVAGARRLPHAHPDAEGGLGPTGIGRQGSNPPRRLNAGPASSPQRVPGFGTSYLEHAMRTAIHVLIWIVRVAGVVQILLGLSIWVGPGLRYLPLHIQAGSSSWSASGSSPSSR